MTEEKPLHVRVAEALGWFWTPSRVPGASCLWLCPPPGSSACRDYGIIPERHERASGEGRICRDGLRYVPRYDTDWAATGPLIEKYGFCLQRNSDHTWWAGTPGHIYTVLEPSPLEAACKLILALSKAGKL